MKYPTLLGAILVLALFLTACGPAATSMPTTMPTTVVTEPPVTESPVATESPTEAATEAPTGAPTEAPTSGVPVTGAANVSVGNSAEYGSVLVDGTGMSLYVFMADTQNGGTSACGTDDGCATEWPALTSDGDPVAGDGVDATMLGTITRDDVTTQVTYNGWPLYHFAGDSASGDTNGQGLDEFGGLWYLVSPAGEAIQQ